MHTHSRSGAPQSRRTLTGLLSVAGILAAAIAVLGTATAASARVEVDVPTGPGAPLGLIGSYAFGNLAGTYADLTGDTAFAVNAGGGTLDDGISADLALPFSFNFGGSVFTTYRVNSNGFIGFGSPTVTYTEFVLNDTINNVIAFLNTDLVNTSAVYSRVTEGAAPNRIHKIQAKNVSPYSTPAQTGNVQVWLYETSNIIEIRYGAFTTWNNSSTTAQVGLRSASTSSIDVRSLVATGPGAWQSPAASNLALVWITLAGAIVPDSGRIYRFTPVPAPYVGASTKSVSQSAVRTGETVTYTLVIANSGDVTATNAYMSDLLPDGAILLSQTLTTVGSPPASLGTIPNLIGWGPANLAPGQGLTVTFRAAITAFSGINITNSALIGADYLGASVLTRTATTAVIGCANDAFYTCTDSTQPGGPTYNWLDATSGTLILGSTASSDDRAAPVTLPFPFRYYGLVGSDIVVGDNGAIIFGAITGTIAFANVPISSAPPRFIAPFWDDLDADTGGIYGKVFGSAPNRVFAVEWFDRPHFNNTPGRATFEVLFYEGSDDIVFQYQDVDFGNAAYDGGASATVGIRGNSVQYSYNVPAVANQRAIHFRPRSMLSKTVDTTPGVCGSTSNITISPASIVFYCYTFSNLTPITLNVHSLTDSALGPLFANAYYELAPGNSVSNYAIYPLNIAAVITRTTLNTAVWTAKYVEAETDQYEGGASARVAVPQPVFVPNVRRGASGAW